MIIFKIIFALLAVIGITLGIVLFMFFIGCLVTLFSDMEYVPKLFRFKSNGRQYISFETFLNLRNVAPDKWWTSGCGYCTYVLYENNRIWMDTLVDVIKLFCFMTDNYNNQVTREKLDKTAELIDS